jgi:hypothetical protein
MLEAAHRLTNPPDLVARCRDARSRGAQRDLVPEIGERPARGTAGAIPGVARADSRLTLDHYAQVVTELGALAAEAMGERSLKTSARDGRAMDADSAPASDRPENDGEGL